MKRQSLMALLAAGLFALGCSKSSDAGVEPPGDLAERAKAAALRESSQSWTNRAGVWTSRLVRRKCLIQLTNLEVRVEAVDLTAKQRQKGISAAVDVFFAASLGRNNAGTNGWNEWAPPSPMRYPVVESNGVLVVENSYRKAYVLPPTEQ